MPFDVIGDIHGCARTLSALLDRLGYRQTDGVYRHPDRRVVYLGDFIDRGPYQREVIAIVRAMVGAGTALAVMGNHEFNAIAYATPDPHGETFLRPRTENNAHRHRAFLDAYADHPDDYAAVIQWFRTLPLWLDLGGLRVVHACWDQQWIDRLQAASTDSYLDEALLLAASRRGTWQRTAIHTLLNGKEIALRNGRSFRDKDGMERHRIRVRWWDHGATTCRDAYLGPESARTHIPEDEIYGEHLVDYTHDGAPVFLGHYWLEGNPEPLAPNIACLDYSVARPGGRLVAYRWQGEKSLTVEHMVSMDRCE